MTPNSAASADPARPVTMSAASTGPSSRTSAMATSGPTKASEPTRCSISMPWSPSTIPVNAPVRRITDMDRRPTNQTRWTAWRTLNGGTNAHRSASARKTPKRPRAESVSRPNRPTPWMESSTSEPVMRAERVSGRAPAGALLREPAPVPERPHREVVGVEVVLQVEDPWEARAVPQHVVPGAVRSLFPQEEVDAAVGRRGLRLPGGHQTEQRPGRLAGPRHAPPLEVRVPVGVTRLSPATVWILAGLEPSDRAPHHRVLDAQPGRLEPAEDRPRAVEVVHPPATVPRAFSRL